MDRAAKLIALASVVAALIVEALLLRRLWPPISLVTSAAFLGSLAASAWLGDVGFSVILPVGYLLPIAFRSLAGHWDATLWLPWTAAVTGAIFAQSIAAPWRFPSPFKGPLLLWILVVALTWPIVAMRELDFSTATLYERHLASSIRGGTPPAAALWTATVASTTLVALLFFDWLWGEYVVRRDRFERRIIVPLFAGALVCGVVAIYQWIGDITFLNPTVFSVMGRAAGTMLDGNALGIIAALWIPFAMAKTADSALQKSRSAGAWLAAAAILCGALWASGSRSALLAATIGLVITTASTIAATQSRRSALLAAGALAFVALLAVALAPSAVGGPIGRLRDSIGPRLQLASFKEALWIRNGYGAAAARMIEEHPLEGVGVGAFNTYVRDVGAWLGWNALEPDNAQNWWRHQLAELGVVGSVGAFAWTILLIVAVFRQRTGQLRSITGAIIGAVVGFGVASIVGMPGQIPLVAVTFIAFAFFVLHDGRPIGASPIRTRTSVAIVATAVVFLIATTIVATNDLRPAYRALRSGWPYHYGFYPVEGVGGDQFRWTANRAVNVIPIEGPWLKLVIGGDVPPDADQHPLHVKVWRDRSVILRAVRRDGSALTRYLRMPQGASWVMLQVETDRTWRPSDYGRSDTRELGVTVAPWTWVNAPPPGAFTID
jgi:hypothetical protein